MNDREKGRTLAKRTLEHAQVAETSAALLAM
jgi:hypothetical protein